MKKLHIAQFGAYDIVSYGDSMFPKMFEYGIKKYIDCEIVLFSMQECPCPYNDNSYVYAFNQFEEQNREKNFDLIIIGGGEFLHYNPIDISINGERNKYPGGYLWKKPIELANKYSIPVVINSVGVPHDFTNEQKKELLEYSNKVDIFSVRDEYSYTRLKNAGVDEKKLMCVADNNWYFNQAYPLSMLDKIRTDLFDRLSIELGMQYIIVQYGTTWEFRQLAEELIKLEQIYEGDILLLPINYCHEDIEATNLIYEFCKKRNTKKIYRMDMELSPLEIMALISGAEMFFGTSLHGNLTAASYGVKMVGLDMYKNTVGKMDGIFNMMNMEEFLLPSVSGLMAAYYRYKEIEIMDELAKRITEIQIRMDRFYKMICERYSGGKL